MDSVYNAVRQELVEDHQLDMVVPPESRVFRSPILRVEFAPGPDVVITPGFSDLPDSNDVISLAKHEFIHYDQAVRQHGEPSEDTLQSYETLCAAVTKVEEELGEDTARRLFTEGIPVGVGGRQWDSQYELAAGIAVYENGLSSVHERVVDSDEPKPYDHKFSEVLEDQMTETEKRRRETLLEPIRDRRARYDLDDESIEVEACFLTLYDLADAQNDKVTADTLTSAMNASDEGEYSFNEQVAATYDLSEKILQGISECINQYEEVRRQNSEMSEAEAAGTVINNSLPRYGEH